MNFRNPLQKVSRGEPARPQAAAWNEFIDTALFVMQQRASQAGAAGFSSAILPGLTLVVRNDSGADLDAGGVLAVPTLLGDLTNLPIDFRRRPVVLGSKPAAATDLVVILTEPILKDESGAAVLLGGAVVDLEVVDASHAFAAPVPGMTDRLRTQCEPGPARIIALEQPDSGSGLASSSGSGSGSGAGLRRAFVLLTGGGGLACNASGSSGTGDGSGSGDRPRVTVVTGVCLIGGGSGSSSGTSTGTGSSGLSAGGLP